VPLVDRRLERIPSGEQGTVPWGEVGDQLLEVRPEAVGVVDRVGQRLVAEEVEEGSCHLETSDANPIRHLFILSSYLGFKQ
jgi:hypothetical protein